MIEEFGMPINNIKYLDLSHCTSDKQATQECDLSNGDRGIQGVAEVAATSASSNFPTEAQRFLSPFVNSKRLKVWEFERVRKFESS